MWPFPLKNNMAALRKGQFDVTRNLLGIERLPPQVAGFDVNLKNVTTSVNYQRYAAPWSTP